MASIRRDLGPIEVPLDVDDRAFSTVLREALAQGKASARDPILFKLDADASDVQRKITQTEVDIERLRSQGVEILFRARSQELQTAIAQSEARLNDLTSKEWTADIAVKILGEQDKIAALRAELGALDQSTFEPAVQVKIKEALGDLATFSAEMGEIDHKRATAVVDLDVNTAGARADIEAFLARQRHRHSLGIDLEVDTDTLWRLATSIGRSLTSIIPDINGTTGAFSGLTNGVKDFFSNFQANLGPLKGSLGTIATTALQIGGALLYVSAVGTGLAFAGAAITAAWGGISTIIGTLPGVLGLVAAAGGTVALGLDGIKKAASTIAPEFDKLKASVAATFEQGMTPAFKQLATIFPQLQSNINGVAKAISITATNMVVLLTSASGLSTLQGIFDKTSAAILGMQPGLRDITATILELANQKSVFDLLTASVNEFGRAFNAAVTTSIASGQFDAAMRGLTETIGALSRGLTDLVRNGIATFAAAAPGLNRAIQSLTDFFNRFDWTRLGAAVGGVFDGLARGLNSVPQGVIDNITRGFEGFAQAVNSPGFQSGLQAAIDLIGRFVAALPAMVDMVGRAAVAFSGFADVVMASVSTVGPGLDLMLALMQGRGDLIGEALLNLGKKGFEAAPLMAQGMAKIAEAAREGGPRIAAGVQAGIAPVGPAVAQAITTAFHPAVPAVQAELAKLGPAATTSLRNADLAIEQGVKNWEATTVAGASGIPPAVGAELSQVPPAAETALAPLQQLEALRGMRDQFTLAAADSMHAMSVGVQSGMAEVQQAFTAGMDTVSTNANSSFGLISQGFAIGMAGLATDVATGMTGVQQSFSTGFSTIATGVGTSIAPIRTNIATAMAGLTQEVANGMIQVTLAFQTGFSGIAVGIGTAIAPIRANIAIAMGGISQEVANGMIQVTLAFQTGFSNIAIGVGTAIAPIRTNVGIAMAGLAQEVTNGMLGVNTAFTVGLTGISTSVSTSFIGINSAVSSGMTGLATTVSTGMSQIALAFNFAPVQASVTQAFAGLTGTINAGMSSLATAAAAGMNGVVTAISTGMAQAVAAVSAAGAQISAAGQQSMAGFGLAISTGMAAAVGSIVAGTAQITASVTSLGQQVVATITASMNTFRVAVTTGMAQSQAAVAAGTAAMLGTLRGAAGQFNAIGVQMMQGLRAGILSQAGSIAAAAAQVVRGAIAAARAEAQVRSPSRVFMGIGLNLGEGLALGMDKSGPRVERAANTMIDSVAGLASQMTSTFSDASWASDFGAKVEASMGDTAMDLSNADVVGAIRRQSGDLDQSPYLAAIVAELRALRKQAGSTGSVALGAQGSRQRAELGAF